MSDLDTNDVGELRRRLHDAEQEIARLRQLVAETPVRAYYLPIGLGLTRREQDLLLLLLEAPLVGRETALNILYPTSYKPGLNVIGTTARRVRDKLAHAVPGVRVETQVNGGYFMTHASKQRLRDYIARNQLDANVGHHEQERRRA